MRSYLKRAVKAGITMSGVDIQQMFSEVRLRRSQRRFTRLGYRSLDGYDVAHHFGDELLDGSFQYVQEGFIIARRQFIQEMLGKEEIIRSTFADIGDSNGVFLKGLGKSGVSINLSRQVLDNIGIILREAKMTYTDVVAVQVYLTDMELFQRMNAIYTAYFKEQRPSRTTVGVTKLAAPGARIEITVTARR